MIAPGAAAGSGALALQQPEWADRGRLEAVVRGLEGMPPLVFAAECDQLKERLASVARGEAFLLQGGDCAETFAGTTADGIRGKLRTLLQMAVVLTYAASVPVVKVGRMAGQFAKPRSAMTEVRDGVELPVYRGDAVNGIEFTAGARTPDPGRLLDAYHCSSVTLNMCRAFARSMPGTRTSWPAARPGSAMSGWQARSTGRLPSCMPVELTRNNSAPW